jgi:hypothetical protein
MRIDEKICNHMKDNTNTSVSAGALGKCGELKETDRGGLVSVSLDIGSPARRGKWYSPLVF